MAKPSFACLHWHKVAKLSGFMSAGPFIASVLLIATAIISTLSAPSAARAGAFSFIPDLFAGSTASASAAVSVQTMPLLEANLNPIAPQKLESTKIEPSIVSGIAVAAEAGPLGTIGSIDKEKANKQHQIAIYTVREGDTLSSIAKMFDVSVNTIRWANDSVLAGGSKLKVGSDLVILPISGVLYTVKKGDTLQSIANRYKADKDEIVSFNGLSVSGTLAIGDTITIPDGDAAVIAYATTPRTSVPANKNAPTSKLRGISTVAYDDYYTRPIDGVRTQGLHGYNGIDFGAPIGTPIVAAAAGDVIIARSGGWNGGYGTYVVISHANGTQTLYGHMSKIIIESGERVYRGQTIGYSGNTGKSTGPHLHFEVRGAKNPFQ